MISTIPKCRALVVLAVFVCHGGVLLHLPFEGGFDDESANSHSVIQGNAVLSIDRLGRENSACYLSGQDSALAVAAVQVNTADITIAFWVSPHSVGGHKRFLEHQWDNGGAFTFSYSDGALAALLRMDGGQMVRAIQFGTIEAGEWYHVTLSYDGTTARSYMDGTPVDSVADDRGLVVATRDLLVGSRGSLMTECKLDEIVVFGSCLSGGQVDSLFAAPPMAVSKPLTSGSIRVRSTGYSRNTYTLAGRATSMAALRYAQPVVTRSHHRYELWVDACREYKRHLQNR